MSLLFVCALVPSGQATAQALSSLEFSFSNPGARSLGFGGAFVALADDATAAVANPAGLVMIAEPELSVETRFWHYSTPYTSGGRAAGEPTGIGIDTVPFPLHGRSERDLTGLSFVSYVHPWKRWSLAVFRHQLANFEFGLETQGVFGTLPPRIPGTARTNIQRSDINLEIVSHGVALAFRPSDRLSLGVGLSRFDSGIAIRGWDYLPDDGPQVLYSGSTFRPDRLIQTVRVASSDDDFGLSAGFLWRLDERWSLGGVYRSAPSFTMKVRLEAGPAHPALPPGFLLAEDFEQAMRFPDVAGLGLAYRSRDGRWTGALEWRHVEYSTILESFLPQQRDEEDKLDDADELHLGGEYAFFSGTSVLAIRLGVWHDPDHQFRSDADPAVNPFDPVISPRGEDELHFAAGAGLALKRLQIDLAVDLSERIDTAALSAIYSF